MIKIIAEIGSNHNNDLDRIYKLIKQAKSDGFCGVKFQLFKAEKLTSDKQKQEKYKKNELNPELLKEIRKICNEFELLFGCTPFDLKSVSILESYVDFFKISSFDILRLDLIEKCCKTKKDVYISMGLADISNIEKVLNLIEIYADGKNLFYLLHCVSKYPTLAENANIGRIRELYSLIINRKKINKFLRIGYSDHTKDIDVVIEALNNFAQVIELHYDLEDGKGNEYKYGHCWKSSDILKLTEKLIKKHKIIQNNFNLTENDKLLLADPITGFRK